jgi:cathepsin F
MAARLVIVCVLACSAIVAFASAPVSDAVARPQFTAFMRKFNKNYASNGEMQVRYDNFKASLQRIAAGNARSKGSPLYGITKFSDLSSEEFRAKMLMKDPIKQHEERKSGVEVLKPKIAAADLPTTFDWRTLGKVTAVKNQEQCGSCWAFSATENIESVWLVAGKANNNTLNLAPQQIVDCDNSDGGCDGGNPPTAYDYVIKAGGLDTEASYPYTAEDGQCAFKSNAIGAKISNWKYATEWYSETTLQQNLVSWAPLSICLDASAWQDYVSGVMTWTECAYVNLLDHCVQLVGYNSAASTPYWMVRNSWGTDWGINGYIWLQMGEDTCGLAHEATSAVV